MRISIFILAMLHVGFGLSAEKRDIFGEVPNVDQGQGRSQFSRVVVGTEAKINIDVSEYQIREIALRSPVIRHKRNDSEVFGVLGFQSGKMFMLGLELMTEQEQIVIGNEDILLKADFVKVDEDSRKLRNVELLDAEGNLIFKSQALVGREKGFTVLSGASKNEDWFIVWRYQ